MIKKITPCLWFNADGGKISSVVDYYKTIFDTDFQAGGIMPLGETPSGKHRDVPGKNI